MKVFGVIALFVGCAAAQSAFGQVSVGVIGGTPFTQLTQDGPTSRSAFLNFFHGDQQYTLGPSLQLGLPMHFRVELDALYRPLQVGVTAGNITVSTTGNQWRFPLLAQYRFSNMRLSPFVSGGVSFNHLSSIRNLVTSNTPGQFLNRNSAGVVLGGGVEGKLGVRVSAEVRYTRDTVSAFRDISNLNQAELLIGIHF